MDQTSPRSFLYGVAQLPMALSYCNSSFILPGSAGQGSINNDHDDDDGSRPFCDTFSLLPIAAASLDSDTKTKHLFHTLISVSWPLCQHSSETDLLELKKEIDRNGSFA